MSKFTNEQLSCAMTEIADCAINARRLCFDAVQEMGPESESGPALLVGLQALLEKIGCIADHHADMTIRGKVPDWMLPPVYHWAAKPGDKADTPS